MSLVTSGPTRGATTLLRVGAGGATFEHADGKLISAGLYFHSWRHYIIVMALLFSLQILRTRTKALINIHSTLRATFSVTSTCSPMHVSRFIGLIPQLLRLLTPLFLPQLFKTETVFQINHSFLFFLLEFLALCVLYSRNPPRKAV